jgi:hypothetical protein
MVSDVRVAQNIGFKFQVIQPVFNDIANADDPTQLPVEAQACGARGGGSLVSSRGWDRPQEPL